MSRRVRDRQLTPRGARAPEPRLLARRAGDEDPREVHQGARGRGVRDAPVGDLHQGVHALIRRVPRPRRAALRRRVQLAVYRRRARRGSARAAPAAGSARARVRTPDRAARAARDRSADRPRDRRVEVRRRRHIELDAVDRHSRAEANAPEGAPVRRSRQGDVSRDPAAVGDRPGRLPGHAEGRRRRVPLGEALLALDPASRRRPVQARRQAGLAPRAPEPQGRRHADEDGPLARLSRPRAIVVVTGSELVRGERTDLNGPFLAREALRLGFEPARIAVVGDAPAELERVLREALADGDAVLVSGGLGPTHDDRTVEVVARALGVALHVEPALEEQIEAVSRAAAERLKRDYADFAPGVTKQATVPDGAIALGLAGTAPGLLIPRERGRVVVVLPGPPGELQRLWPNALQTDAFRELLARTRAPGRRV